MTLRYDIRLKEISSMPANATNWFGLGRLYLSCFGRIFGEISLTIWMWFSLSMSLPVGSLFCSCSSPRSRKFN